ncbi:Hypothetical protein PP7435_CHR1-0240 [Komagataella phaffii CBS 7435]|uniref:VPS9 domain-containing protein n=2 Tax=Komagataella phaffii TaxID=460519 RepID=C4QVM3_KOMPG|nr:Hypothetical protein PAS_chr1-3_0234 [Komagataella phaffii GS115]AOA60923.1 GQ67_02495T0 [Komagataella phaffii]CAH2445953.1 Hypothetical protein BQ9382_C1-1245 [Komagataella phaffii CBS 7435]AOA66009.1 GQ68_02752T0 [Komagataella phaffii GS115]CAY67296.1 Hypothetical protein PAS_chr1-3_0234 [Komagataella phaffii GS115]CCA36401.1 Hypothetical protein PP7435_CHR1-0240 [Komagataella phaffii CBS 7435]
MLHTPSIRESHDKSQSVVNSYEQDDTEKALNDRIESFIQSLREPKFDKPLTLDEIGSLFQTFYDEYHQQAVILVGSQQMNGISRTPLASSQEDLSTDENKPFARPVDRVFLYDQRAEKRLTDLFYSKLYSSSSSATDAEINVNLNTKLDRLRMSNLSLEQLALSCEGTSQQLVKKLSAAHIDRVLVRLKRERGPFEKITSLAQIHDLINSVVSLDGDSSLALAIFVCIYFFRDLFLQLHYIRRFSNPYVLQEHGKLSYSLTNFQAALEFLLNVTAKDLGLSDPAITALPAHEKKPYSYNLRSFLGRFAQPLPTDEDDRLLSKLTSSVMKNLRPLSASPSSTSLNEGVTASLTPKNARSRATSLIGQRRNSNSCTVASNELLQLVIHLKKNDLHNKQFEQLTILELRQLLHDYKTIMDTV